MQKISTNNIPRLCKLAKSLGYKNLLVSGCSFTSVNFGLKDFYLDTLKKNYDLIRADSDWPSISSGSDWDMLPSRIKDEVEVHCNWKTLTYITWPIYIRDLLGFSDLYDCSASGAGNTHIHNSVIYALENNQQLTKDNTLVIVMWSGFDRDDFIADQLWVKSSRYEYDSNVSLGLTGGVLCGSNLKCSVDNIKRIKSDQSRAVENYINIVSLYHYLKSRNFNFIFTKFSTDIFECQVDIKKHISLSLRAKWDLLFSDIPTLGDYSKDTIDGSHPTPDWHLNWAKDILMPEILKNIKKELV